VHAARETASRTLLQTSGEALNGLITEFGPPDELIVTVDLMPPLLSVRSDP